MRLVDAGGNGATERRKGARTMFAEVVDSMPPWFSLLIQTGSFGVLVYLIVWALPKLRKEIASEQASQVLQFREDTKAERTEFTAALAETRQDFRQSLEATTLTFKNEARAERESCEKHFATLAGAMSKGNDATIAAVKTMADQIAQAAERSRIHDERNRRNDETLRAALENRKQPDAE